MRRFATTIALLTIAFSTAACDPYQAITNQLPGGCDPASDSWSAHPTPTLPGTHQKSVTWQHEDVRPADPPVTGTGF